MSFLRLTPGQASSAEGLILLRLALWNGSREVAHLPVISGLPGRQVLRKAADSPAHSFEPIPEGEYLLGDGDADHGINWASGREGDYAGSWGEGLGPVWVGIHPAPGNPSSREDLGIHLDANAAYSPGTSGCVGLQTLTELRQVASWFAGADWPRHLEVDYGLGTITKREHN